MPFYDNEGVKIYYEIEGTGPEVVLIHGYSGDMEAHWKNTQIVNTLKTENRLIMMDCRGHGKSDKPVDPAMYGAKMLDDITGLMYHLGIDRANFLGYSMGSILCVDILLIQPERVKSAILSAYVLQDLTPKIRDGDPVAESLLADSSNQVVDPMLQRYREWIELTGGNLKALAAVRLGWKENPVPELLDFNWMLEKIQSISVPLMTIVGSNDHLSGDRSRMARLVTGGCHLLIQGANHFNVFTEPIFYMAVRAFLNYVNAR